MYANAWDGLNNLALLDFSIAFSLYHQPPSTRASTVCYGRRRPQWERYFSVVISQKRCKIETLLLQSI